MQNSRSHRSAAGAVITGALFVAAGVSGLPTAAGAQSSAVYVAKLAALNTSVTGTAAVGKVTFTVEGDSLTIATDATGLPKDITHWQHFHGFKDGHASACPAKSADANGDGIIDLIETEPAAGTTMVPFTDDPVSMDVAHGTYPKATAGGALHYRQTVSLSALQEAFGKAFDGQKLDLEKRVVFLHGVPSDTKLATSVASLGPIPAQVTLPIACGKVTRVK